MRKELLKGMHYTNEDGIYLFEKMCVTFVSGLDQQINAIDLSTCLDIYQNMQEDIVFLKNHKDYSVYFSKELQGNYIQYNLLQRKLDYEIKGKYE